MTIRKLFSRTFIALLLAVPIVAYIHKQDLFDIYKLSGYSASSEITQLATDTAMEPSTRRLFYVYHPVLEDKTTFNMHCRSDEQTIVLGCFVD